MVFNFTLAQVLVFFTYKLFICIYFKTLRGKPQKIPWFSNNASFLSTKIIKVVVWGGNITVNHERRHARNIRSCSSRSGPTCNSNLDNIWAEAVPFHCGSCNIRNTVQQNPSARLEGGPNGSKASTSSLGSRMTRLCFCSFTLCKPSTESPQLIIENLHHRKLVWDNCCLDSVFQLCFQVRPKKVWLGAQLAFSLVHSSFGKLTFKITCHIKCCVL